MERSLLCALVLLSALRGVSAVTEKVSREDTFRNLEQLREADFFSPDEIWLDDELYFSDSPLMSYLDNDVVEGIDWSGPAEGADWDFNIIIIILAVAEIVGLGFCLYHPTFRHFLRSCCMQCCRWWVRCLCVPSMNRILDIPQPCHDTKCRAPSLSAAAILRVIKVPTYSSDDAGDGTPVTTEDRAHCTSHHIPDNLGDNIV